MKKVVKKLFCNLNIPAKLLPVLKKTIFGIMFLFLCAAACALFSTESYAGGGDHDHVWSEEWAYDSEYHWHECQGSGTCDIRNSSKNKGFAPHNFDASGVCTECFYNSSWNVVTKVKCIDIFCDVPFLSAPEASMYASSEGFGYTVGRPLWVPPAYDGRFDQGTEYIAQIYVYANSNYMFLPDSPETNTYTPAFVNGFPATYMCIASNTAYVMYKFPATMTCVTGNLEAKPVGMNTVTVSWEESFGADGYLILRDGPQIGYTGRGVCTYTDTSASADKFNYYWVIPYTVRNGKIKKGQLSDYTWAIGRKIGQVKNVSVKAGTGSAAVGTRLSWESIPGANAYVVIAKTDKSAVKDPPRQVSTNSYTDYFSVPGIVRFYWVYGIYVDNNGHVVCAGPVSDYAWGITK